MKQIADRDIAQELIGITKQFLSESGEPSYQREIKIDASLQRHLGIDSIGRAELFRRIEKTFGVTVSDRLLAQAETLQDIADYLRKDHPELAPVTHSTIITSHGNKSIVNPMSAQTLIDVLLLYGEHAAEKAHIYFQGEDGKEEVITYGQLLTASLQVAQGLKLRGLKEGETVAIMQPTTPDFFYIFFGTLLAGGIPVPIYPPFRMNMLEAYAKTEASILRNAEVRMLVTFAEAEKLSRILSAFVPSLKLVTTVAELRQTQMLETIFTAKSDHSAFIQYTSGSTANPKGVLLAHKNLLANIRGYGKAIAVTPDDVAVSWLPLYHDMGLIGMWLGSLYYGIPLVLLTPFSFLNRPERWLWAIHHHRGTLSGAPNFAYELCIRKIESSMIEGLDLSSWRLAANGAEKVYPHTLTQFADKFKSYGLKRSCLVPVYGLAESTVALAVPPMDREFRVDYVDQQKFTDEHIAHPSTEKNAAAYISCGKPLEGHEIRIVGDQSEVLTERHVGRLHFRGPSSMQGYYNNQAATQAIYHDGWFDSGDLAYLAEGEVFITGRAKDLIIKAGRNFYPAEIEEQVNMVADIRQGCVIAFGVTNEERGTEQLIIVAETRKTNKEEREKIIAEIQDKIASALDITPDDIVLVAPHTVPKTSSGKLQRAAGKKLYVEERLKKWHLPVSLQVMRLSSQWFVKRCWSALRRLSQFIYTFYVLLVGGITFIPLYLVVYFGSPRTAMKACQFWGRFLIRASGCPLRVVGLENASLAAPVIFAVNHTSYIDALIVLSIVPPNTRFVGKKELFSVPVLRTFLSKLQALSVDRGDLPKGIEDTKHIEAALKSGNSVLIFPEGTFSYAVGLRPFRLGAFKIAAETNVAVCPIALSGTRMVLRDDEKLLRPNIIHVTICKPIKAHGSEWQDITQLRGDVRNEIAQYCGEPSLDLIAAQTVAPKGP